MEIQPAIKEQLDELCVLYDNCVRHLQDKGIDQWNEQYQPTREFIQEDISNDNLFVLKDEDKIIGAICLEDTIHVWDGILYKDVNGKPINIFRIAVSPDYQGRGYGSILMNFADEYAKKYNYTSISRCTFEMNIIKFFSLVSIYNCAIMSGNSTHHVFLS